jgi:hypothetical protein
MIELTLVHVTALSLGLTIRLIETALNRHRRQHNVLRFGFQKADVGKQCSIFRY